MPAIEISMTSPALKRYFASAETGEQTRLTTSKAHLTEKSPEAARDRMFAIGAPKS